MVSQKPSFLVKQIFGIRFGMPKPRRSILMIKAMVVKGL